MDETRAAADRGFTLIETVIAVAVIATVVAAGVAVSLGARSFAVATAAAEFDHLLDSARTIARETQGATLVFAPDAYGDGTEVRVLTTGPNGTLVPTSMPVVRTRAAIAEDTLGSAPFAFVVHLTGALGGRPGFRLGDSTASGEVGCPPSGAFHFVIRAAGGSAERRVPCRIDLVATGPLTFLPWPPAVIAPQPTPCGGPCGPVTLPTPPSSSPACPPGFTPNATGCTPPAPGGARYHVTASVASSSLAAGASTALTAQTTLTNATSVAPGTPSTIPVVIQDASAAVCSTTPPGSQPSGSQFVVTAIAAGTCTISVGADPSAVPGASADTTTLTITVTTTPAATPTPAACDLITNGKCYHRIVDRTAQTFFKHVLPDDNCGAVPPDVTCTYVNAPKLIYLEPGLSIHAPLPADSKHELLIKYDAIIGVLSGCLHFEDFASLPVGGPIQWGSFSVGTPSVSDGIGQPTIYMTESRILPGFTGPGVFDLEGPWAQSTTLIQMEGAVALGSLGAPYAFTYSTEAPIATSDYQLYPDFPGCDAVDGLAMQYGNAGVSVTLEIYQAA